MRQLQKYAALPSADRWLLLSATFWLVFCRIALWILPFQDILCRIESMDGGAPTTANPAAAARIAWAVLTASRRRTRGWNAADRWLSEAVNSNATL